MRIISRLLRALRVRKRGYVIELPVGLEVSEQVRVKIYGE